LTISWGGIPAERKIRISKKGATKEPSKGRSQGEKTAHLVREKY